MESIFRRTWVIVSNSAMIFLVWPRDSAADQLNRAMGNAQSSVFGLSSFIKHFPSRHPLRNPADRECLLIAFYHLADFPRP
jgi:hypothetical protein